MFELFPYTRGETELIFSPEEEQEQEEQEGGSAKKRRRPSDDEDDFESKRSRNADSVSVVLHLDGDSDELPGSTILWNAGLYVSDEDTVAVTAVQECSAPDNDGLRGGWVLTGCRSNGTDFHPPRSWRVMYEYFLDTEGDLELIFSPP